MSSTSILERTRSVAQSRPAVLIGGALIATLAVLLPYMLPGDKWVRVAALALIYVALASGLNILVGVTGLLDLGYIAFFVVGAYTTAILTVKVFVDGFGFSAESLWWLLPVSLVGALLFATIAGTVIGFPTLRARGDYLAIMTLAFGEIIRLVTINWIDFTGGSVGIRNIPPVGVGGIQLITPQASYYVALVVVILLLLAIARVVTSPIGRAWVAIREDELVASTLGVRARRYKLLAYICGACVAGVAGVFFAHMQQFINPDSFSLDDNFVVLSLVIIGGAGTFWGPALGATLWIFFQAWARELSIVQEHPEFRTGFLALIVIILMISRPEGILTRRLRLITRSSRERLTTIMPTASAADQVEQVMSDHRVDATAQDTGVQPTGEPGAAVLRAEQLTKRFGGLTAMKDVTFHLQHGEILGLMGPNGAGKSTLINILSGITAPSTGTLTLNGQPYRSDPVAVNLLGVARTFQTVRLFADMTVLENLLVGAHDRVRGSVFAQLFGRTRQRKEQAAIGDAVEVLRLVGMHDAWQQRAGKLTYERQRRLEIARALMTRPTVLLLDEPAAGMNETETKELGQLIRDIRDQGISIVLIEHDMDLLMSISERIVVLDHGEVIATGTPEQVRLQPEVVEAYLGKES